MLVEDTYGPAMAVPITDPINGPIEMRPTLRKFHEINEVMEMA